MAHVWIAAEVISLLGLYAYTTSATPAIAFPFNSQVPTVARVGQLYEFQFSASTFAAESTNVTYSLSNQPSWLLLDSATRTLSGAPSQADVGASSFTLTAADSTGAAHMACTLVISTNPPPQIEWGISEQLAAEANLSSSQPPVVTVLPSSPFHFDFRQDSFIDIVQRKLSYYATLTDHTPLPAWLAFNPDSLTFSGTAPQLSAFPQSWEIALIASDVEGFAGATANFTIAIGTQQLIFVPQQYQVNVTAGMHLLFERLQGTLFLNGHTVNPGTLKTARASVPSWLSFDPGTLSLSGVVPSDISDQTVDVFVADRVGNEATAKINLVTGPTSLFSRKVGTLTAHSDEDFQHHFSDSLFTDTNVSLMVTLPATAEWLHFNSNDRNLSGHVPTVTVPSTIEATLTAKSHESSPGQAQTFKIELEPAVTNPTSLGKPMSRSSVVTAPTLGPGRSEITNQDGKHDIPGKVVAGIVVGTVSVAAILIAFMIFCWRRRRRPEGYVEAVSPKRTISRPILPPDPDAITVTTEVQTDIEKQADSIRPQGQIREVDSAPQLALDLPQANKRLKIWNKRASRASKASSLGNGEDAIRTDSNIPEWGRQSTALDAPHDSFSIPAEMAHSSRHIGDLSPSKRMLRRLREKRHSRQNIGLGIDTGGVGLMPRHSSRGTRTHRRALSSFGSYMTQDRSSVATRSTRGTSVLSTRPSDFPRPPKRSTRSIPGLSFTDAEQRKSIRLVERSDSIPDNRSIEEKRKSFIRNRASTSLASPLFAHGSRASSNPLQNGRGSSHGLPIGSERRSKGRRSQATTYSESSSLEPPARDPRRLSARCRSAFAPNFPRATTRTSLGADDEGGAEREGSSSGFYTTSGSITEGEEPNLAAQMALPRHKRNFVLPGEASPTPPPAPTTSRQASSARQVTPLYGNEEPRHKWKDRLREQSSSPLSTAVAVPLADKNRPSASANAKKACRSTLNEPLSLVSNDSLSRAKLERPRLVQTNSRRPVSVEKVQRLSSLKAETEDARPGSEMWEAMQSAGLMPTTSGEGRNGTQKSNLSGPAFL